MDKKIDPELHEFACNFMLLTKSQRKQTRAKMTFTAWRNGRRWDKDTTLWTMALGAGLVFWDHLCQFRKE